MSHEGEPFGVVEALYRYPIKSTAGESVQVADFTSVGLKYDRHWAVYTADGGIASGKRTRRFRPVHGLMNWVSTIDDSEGVPTLQSPGGLQYRADDPAASEALSAAFGQKLTLRPQTTVQHHDESPLHLLTTSSLAALADVVGAPVDARRFRPNIVLRTRSSPTFIEDHLIGAVLVVGTGGRLTIGAAMPRCVMVDQGQAEVPAGAKALKSLGVHSRTLFGFQVGPTKVGTIRVGDCVTLLEPTAL